MTLTPEDLAELRMIAELAADDRDRPSPMLGSSVLALLDMIEDRQADTPALVRRADRHGIATDS